MNLMKIAKKGLVFALGGVATIIIFLVVVNTFFNPVNRLMTDIENGDFVSAMQIYQDDIVGDKDKYQKCSEKISDYLEELLEQYREGGITFDFLDNKLSGISRLNILTWKIENIYADASTIQFYREIYELAEQEFNEGNYKNAVIYYGQAAYGDFEKNQEASEKYDQAVEMLKCETTAKVQSYIELRDYLAAIASVDDALEVLPEDSELLALRKSCLEAEHNAEMKGILDTVNGYIADKDYASALEYLDSCIPSYPEEIVLVEKRDDCLAEYEAYVIAESISLANNGEYQQALSLAESGTKYLTSPEITELVEIYRSHIPVILGEMEAFKSDTDDNGWNSKTDVRDEYLKDSYGNTYEHSLSVGCGYIIYLVDHKYQTFSGTVAFPKGLKSDSWRKSATLTIYGDDKKIAEFSNICDTTKPEDFSLDISSYEKIQLSWECTGTNIWGNWGEFATIFNGVLYPIPMELPSGVLAN